MASHPARGAWIEIYFNPNPEGKQVSHPARGAWIEISCSPFRVPIARLVAPRKGCVD